jgi:hypothetical protein
MKIFLLAVPLAISILTYYAEISAPPLDQAEYNKLRLQVAIIKERFVAMGTACGLTSACPMMISEYLRNIGTPVALNILEELKKEGLIKRN